MLAGSTGCGMERSTWSSMKLSISVSQSVHHGCGLFLAIHENKKGLCSVEEMLD